MGGSSSQLSRRVQPGAVAAAAAVPATTAEPSVTQKAQAEYTGQLTYITYEANSWEVTFGQTGVTVLVDPWLVGDLVFGGQAWAYRGSKGPALATAPPDVDAIAARTDLILLSQALDDHAHRPTLQRLPKHLAVVASPAAAELARELGYRQVTAVDHGQSVEVAGGRLRVTGTAGAQVGPPWSKRENGFLLEELPAPRSSSLPSDARVSSPSSSANSSSSAAHGAPSGQAGGGDGSGGAAAARGLRLYYEPHCDFDESSVAALGRVDVVVTPPASQLLAGLYPVVRGNEGLLPLLHALRPRLVIPLSNATFQQSGPLSWIIRQAGGSDAAAAKLAAAGLGDVRLEQPAPPGQAKTFQV